MSAEVKRPKYIGMHKAGKMEEVDLDEHWDAICKILRICRLLTSPNHSSRSDYELQTVRLAFLSERMSDLEGVNFFYRRQSYGINLEEMFVPAKQPIMEILQTIPPPK